MLKNCITERTDIMLIETESLPVLTEENYDYYEELAKSMSVEMGIPKELLISGIHFFFIDCWHKIDDKWFFFKEEEDELHFFNELLGEVISEYFGLDTVHYKVGKLIVGSSEPKIGVVSENFCSSDYKYTRIFDYPNFYRGYANDIQHLEKLRDLCASDEEFKLLFADFKKFMIRDFYTSQGDRTGSNFLFKEKNDGSEGKRLATLYDYENGFEVCPSDCLYNALIYQEMKERKLRRYFKRDAEYQESLEKLRDANMNAFLTEVEERHSILIPQDVKKFYIEADKRKKEIVKKNRLVKVLKPKCNKREIAS